jgi:hypothetical protein
MINQVLLSVNSWTSFRDGNQKPPDQARGRCSLPHGVRMIIRDANCRRTFYSRMSPLISRFDSPMLVSRTSRLWSGQLRSSSLRPEDSLPRFHLGGAQRSHTDGTGAVILINGGAMTRARRFQVAIVRECSRSAATPCDAAYRRCSWQSGIMQRPKVHMIRAVVARPWLDVLTEACLVPGLPLWCPHRPSQTLDCNGPGDFSVVRALKEHSRCGLSHGDGC